MDTNSQHIKPFQLRKFRSQIVGEQPRPSVSKSCIRQQNVETKSVELEESKFQFACLTPASFMASKEDNPEVFLPIRRPITLKACKPIPSIQQPKRPTCDELLARVIEEKRFDMELQELIQHYDCYARHCEFPIRVQMRDSGVVQTFYLTLNISKELSRLSELKRLCVEYGEDKHLPLRRELVDRGEVVDMCLTLNLSTKKQMEQQRQQKNSGKMTQGRASIQTNCTENPQSIDPSSIRVSLNLNSLPNLSFELVNLEETASSGLSSGINKRGTVNTAQTKDKTSSELLMGSFDISHTPSK